MRIAFSKPQFIVDKNGKHKAVVINIRQYHKILQLLEDLSDNYYIKTHQNEEEISLEELLSQLQGE